MQNKLFSLPDEIRRNHILQQVSLEELHVLRRVSRSWKNQIEQDAPYVPQLIDWLSPLDQVIKIEPSQRFKKYQEIHTKMAKLQIRRSFFIFSEKRTEQEIFEKAIKTGDCELAHGLLKRGNVSVDARIETAPISTGMYIPITPQDANIGECRI